MSYDDDFAPHPPPAYSPSAADWSTRPRWPRLLGLVLLSLLAMLHACG